MADDPLGKLADDARERPVLYATVAVAGLAGVAAAIALTARAAPPTAGRSLAGTLLRHARSSLLEAGERASDAASGAADPRSERTVSAARDAAREVARDAVAEAERLREARPGTRADASAGIGGGTAAVFLGTLASKAITGWMRLRAEERARDQGMALARRAGRAPGDPLRSAGSGSTRPDEMNVTELRALASEREIEGRSSMNKDELVQALSDADRT